MTSALIILCGGLSTRMGSDKAFLPFGKSSLLHYQIRRFRPYFDKIYVSVPAKKERPIDYQAYCGCEEITDTASQLGPLGGIYSCLQQAREEILFFISVDAPFTDPSLALTMTQALAEDGDAYAMTIEDPSGRLQPTFSAYKKDCLPIVEELIARQTYKMKLLFQTMGKNIHYRVYDVFHPTSQFFNMNDPQSYYYALHQLALTHPQEFPPDFLLSQSADSGQKDLAVSYEEKSVVHTTDGRIIPILSFTAKSGTGKTTYLEKFLPLLKAQGIRIAVVKHDAHGFEIDKPGKDSYRLSHAGADHMILTSENQTASIIRHQGLNPEFNAILQRIQNVDLILTEGYKLGNQKKIHLLRKGHNEIPVGSQNNTIAYITDFPFQADVPVFDLNHPEDLLDFVLNYMKATNC